MMDTAPVGTGLRDARRAAGLSQEALAARAGVGRATVERAEHGHVQPRLVTRRALAAALRVPVERIWPEPYDDQLAAYVEQAPAA